MKKKTFLASSLFLTTAVTGLVLAFLRNDNLFINALSEESEPHQIILTRADTTEEKESTHTKYFKLHQDNATMSGFSFDSTSEECLIMADGDRGVGGSWICFGEANSLSGTCASLIVTFSLTNIKSFTDVVFRGEFYPDFSLDYENEIRFGSEKFIANEFQAHISNTYKKIYLSEIEINYTCAI